MVSANIDQVKQSKIGLAKMLKNGVIMDVTNVEEAIIAQNAGAAAVMALERVPADIRKEGGVARMSDPSMIEAIMKAVSIPVMAKVRIGHFVEAQILESLGVDFIDESEVLTVADRAYHIEKENFKVPFVCGAKDLGEALRRYEEGAAMIRSKGEAGTGDISEAVYHVRKIKEQLAEVVAQCQNLDANDPIILEFAETCRVKPETIFEISNLNGSFPLVNFAAGGVASPADAALCMQLGCDGVFVGSGIFKSEYPEKLASAIVNSVKNYDNPALLLKYSTGLGGLMFGIQNCDLKEGEKLSSRGW